MAFPLLVATVWVGVRFSTLLSVLHSFAVGTATIVLTLAGIGPFAQLANEEVGILLAQFFLAMLLVSGLLLATGRDERVLLADELAVAREDAVYQAGLLDTVITSMAEGIAVIDETGEILMLNPAGARALGYSETTAPTSVDGLDQPLHRRSAADRRPAPQQQGAPGRGAAQRRDRAARAGGGPGAVDLGRAAAARPRA